MTTRRRAPARRGLALSDSLLLLAAATLVCVAGIAVGPTFLRAAADDRDIVPADAKCVFVCDRLREILDRSTAVIAARNGGQTGVTHLVLWHSDDGADRVLDPSEVLLLTHSAFRAVLEMSVVTPPSPDDARYHALVAPVDPATAEAPSFVERWRERPDVRTEIIATDVGQVVLEGLEGPGLGGGFRIRLTWAASADDEIPAEAVLHVSLPGARDLINGRTPS